MPDSTRDRLLQAAREVVAKEGLEGLTLRAIARHAGVSHGAPLRHFPTLASLLAAVGADGFDRLVAAVDAALAAAPGAGAIERVSIAGRAYVENAVADPGVFSVTFRPERVDVGDPAYQRAGDRAFSQIETIVAAAQLEGWHPEQPTRPLAATLWAQVHGLSELMIHGALTHVVGDDPLGVLEPVLGAVLFGAPAPGPAPAPAPATPTPDRTNDETAGGAPAGREEGTSP